jgi:hypothetical protein
MCRRFRNWRQSNGTTGKAGVIVAGLSLLNLALVLQFPHGLDGNCDCDKVTRGQRCGLLFTRRPSVIFIESNGH